MKSRVYVPSLDYLMRHFFVTDELPDPGRVTYSEYRIPVLPDWRYCADPDPTKTCRELRFKRERLQSAYMRDSLWVWHKIEE